VVFDLLFDMASVVLDDPKATSVYKGMSKAEGYRMFLAGELHLNPTLTIT
jgi:hypothetical protein